MNKTDTSNEQEERELTQDPEHLLEEEDKDEEDVQEAREEGGLRKDPEDKAEDTDDKHHPS